MNTLRTFATSFFCILFFSVFSQTAHLEFKLALLPDGQTWGVFLKPDNTILPTLKTHVGTGQVTIVAPKGFVFENFTNLGGNWVQNSRVDGPVEAADKAYISFGCEADEPKIQLFPYYETLLFSFTTPDAANVQIALFENESDPFSPPNSYNSNPGNDIGMIDYGIPGGNVFYTYSGNHKADQADYKTLLAKDKTDNINAGHRVVKVADKIDAQPNFVKKSE